MTPEQLKASILQRAMEGKLVPQNPNDEPASELLKRIKAEKEKLISEGKIKRDKKETEIFRGDDGKHYEKFADGSVQEIDVPYAIPDTWEWVRIRNIGTITSGGTPKSSEPLYYGGEIIWITPADMGKQQNHKFFKTSSKLITELGLQKSSAKLISKNSIVYSSRAPIGYINIVREDFTTNQGCKSVTPLIININFLYWILQGRTKDIILRSSGTTFKEISAMEFGSTLVPIPPLAEQQRIVGAIESALEKVDEYAESYNRLEQLDKEFPDKLKKSILQYAMQGKLVEQDPNDESVEVLLEKIRVEKQKLFEEGKIKKKDLEISIVSQGDDNSYYGKIPMNWVQTTLNYIGIISTGNTPSKNSPENYGGEIPFYKPADLLQGELYNATEYLSVLGNTKSRKIKAGSILINGIGNIGIAGIVRVDGAFNQQMHGIEVFNFVNSKFLLLAIQSDFMQKQFKNNTSSTTIPILNKTRFSQTIINFPGIRTQKLIITKAEKLFEKVSQFPE